MWRVQVFGKRLQLIAIILTLGTLACNIGSRNPTSTDDLRTRPLVLLIAPVNGSTYAEGTQVEFYALAQDLQGRIARLEFRVDDVPIATSVPATTAERASLSARASWRAQGRTKHLVTAEIFLDDGRSLGLADVVIQVAAPPVGGVPPTPAPTAPPAAPTPTLPVAPADVTAEVLTNELNIRQGPGTQYPSVGTLARGARVNVIGRSVDGQWWAIPYHGGAGWIFAALTRTEGNTDALPLVAPP